MTTPREFRTLLIALLSLVASVGTASAECAWVLWSATAGRAHTPDPQSGARRVQNYLR